MLPAGGGAAENAEVVLEAMHEHAPDDPLWKGVAKTEVVNDGVAVSFHPGLEPRKLEVDGVELECHLHDAEAMEAARELGAKAPSAPSA